VKPERIELTGVCDVRKLAERVVRTRLREARGLTDGLQVRDTQGLHDFRIACKRLRYALERFGAFGPSHQHVAEGLARLQDALGEAHDRDVLLAILPPAMASTERRLRAKREECVDRASSLWRKLDQMMQALDSHRITMSI
jgi:CHAD domain-containing protein